MYQLILTSSLPGICHWAGLQQALLELSAWLTAPRAVNASGNPRGEQERWNILNGLCFILLILQLLLGTSVRSFSAASDVLSASLQSKTKLGCELGELHPARALMDFRGVNLHWIKCWNRSLKFSDCCPGCWLSSCSLHDLSPTLRCFLLVSLSQGRFMARTQCVPCMSMASEAAGAGHSQQGWVQVGKTHGK